MESDFILNENNEIVYLPDEETAGEEKDLYGQPVDDIPVEGNDIADEVEASEIDEEADAEIPTDNPLDSYSSDSPLPVALSDEVTQALLSIGNPAGGALGSSTLTYFDRIISGLPSECKYVAYRTDTNDSYDGVLIYGRHYSFDGSHVVFGKDAVAVTVDRTSGNNSVTNYKTESAEGWSCTPVQNGSVVYYSNVKDGFPVLGGYAPSLGVSSFIVVGLLCAMASAVLTKLLLKR